MSARLEIELKLNGPQRHAMQAALAARRRSIFLGFGRGVGKSWALRHVWYLLVARFDGRIRTEALSPFRGVRITALMPTLKQFKDVHLANLQSELGAGGEFEWLNGRVDRQTGHVRFPGGSTIRPFPASEYNARTSRGLRTDVLSVDEIDDVAAGVYDAVAVPWLSEPWSLGLELLSGTPTRGRHGLWWRSLQAGKLGRKLRRGLISPEDALALPEAQAVLDVFLELGEKDWPAELPRDPQEAALQVLRNNFAYHATYRDAPETVSPLAVARAKQTTNPATFRREWEADPDAGEGLVYPFDEAFHVREPPDLNSFREFIAGMDHGWVDPGVILVAGVTGHGEDSVLWILDESYESEVPNRVWDERAVAFAQQYRGLVFWPDPSRPDRSNDLRQRGLTVQKPDNDILNGIARVADLLFIRPTESGTRFARMYVSPKCKNLIREFGLYRRKKLPNGDFDEMPEDKNNHCLEAGTLVATARGQVAIEEVTTGDRVLTRQGWRSVQWSGKTFESAPLWTIETTVGTVTGTPDHRVWTDDRGWIRLDALRYGDTLVSWENTAHPSPCDTTARSSGATRTRPIPTLATTGGRSADGTCTACSGRTASAKSPKVTTSTTGTETRPTTPSKTSNASPALTISRITGATLRTSSALVGERAWIASAHLLQLGTPHPRARSGTARTASKCSEICLSAHASANSAELSSPRRSPAERGSAATTAERRVDAAPVPTTKSEAAASAAEPLRSTGTSAPKLVPARVLASRSAERSAAVYDLTVEGEHEFFANGVLVHNSLDSARYLTVGRFGIASIRTVTGR